MDELARVKMFAREVARVLKIDVPEIRLVKGFAQSATMMAAADPFSGAISIRESIATMDKLFSVAHEMRHMWQKRRAPKMLDGYKANDGKGLAAYNDQDAELDANAFAQAIFELWFGVRPLFNGMDAGTVARIGERSRVVLKELKTVR